MNTPTTLAFVRQALAAFAHEHPRFWVHYYDVEQMVEVRAALEKHVRQVPIKMTEVLPGIACVFEFGDDRLTHPQLAQIAQKRITQIAAGKVPQV